MYLVTSLHFIVKMHLKVNDNETFVWLKRHQLVQHNIEI